MKAKVYVLLAALCLGASHEGLLFADHHKHHEQRHIDRALCIFEQLLDPAHPIDRSFQRYCDEIIHELRHVKRYESFCLFLNSIRHKKNHVQIALAFDQYEKKMPKEIKADFDRITKRASRKIALDRLGQAVKHP